ncbi:MAG: hypothetical protein HYS07_07970 [Chlamydiae bacterium]|nr:hypothetical protein [Chlamydiota bacterium]MBI3278073.1 hypothetical protein [Chlamydiota bacterium]
MLRGGFIVLVLGIAFLSMGVQAGLTEESRVILSEKGETVKENACGALLEATGIGEPRQGYSPTQARFMAERAATVRAYRNLVRAVDQLSPVLARESSVVSMTGFIHGARIVEKSYLSGGRVEVKIVMDLSFPHASSNCGEWVSEKVRGQGLPVDQVDRHVTEISEDQWVELNQ